MYNKKRKIPLIQILTLKDLDRVNPLWLCLLLGFIFVILGVVFSLVRIFAWVGGFILFLYILFSILWIYTKIK